MRFVPFLALTLLLGACVPGEEAPPLVTVYKSPTCGCCSLWIDHLEENGFRVEAVDVDDLAAIKRQYGIP
ncbi:MAG TPA: glutaredoxin domain-containing protein, partial [Rubricoccaceae bacterium]|nr:glutaredoxin domain-containing protein [Rubricoccaceae bacterium]